MVRKNFGHIFPDVINQELHEDLGSLIVPLGQYTTNCKWFFIFDQKLRWEGFVIEEKFILNWTILLLRHQSEFNHHLVTQTSQSFNLTFVDTLCTYAANIKRCSYLPYHQRWTAIYHMWKSNDYRQKLSQWRTFVTHSFEFITIRKLHYVFTVAGKKKSDQ